MQIVRPKPDLISKVDFSISREGLYRGDLFSPNIFNSVLEQVFSHLDWKGKKIKIKT